MLRSSPLRLLMPLFERRYAAAHGAQRRRVSRARSASISAAAQMRALYMRTAQQRVRERARHVYNNSRICHHLTITERRTTTEAQHMSARHDKMVLPRAQARTCLSMLMRCHAYMLPCATLCYALFSTPPCRVAAFCRASAAGKRRQRGRVPRARVTPRSLRRRDDDGAC